MSGTSAGSQIVFLRERVLLKDDAPSQLLVIFHSTTEISEKYRETVIKTGIIIKRHKFPPMVLFVVELLTSGRIYLLQRHQWYELKFCTPHFRGLLKGKFEKKGIYWRRKKKYLKKVCRLREVHYRSTIQFWWYYGGSLEIIHPRPEKLTLRKYNFIILQEARGSHICIALTVRLDRNQS